MAYVDPKTMIAGVQPGDTLTFNLGEERVTGRAWPVTRDELHVELRGGNRFVALGEIDPERDELEIRKAPRGRKRLMRAEAVLDFRPGVDRVVRVGGRHFVVSGDGSYAAVEVDEPPASVFTSNYAKAIANGWDATRQFAAVLETPYLSEEGRKERLDFLLSMGEVRLSFTITA